MHQLHELFDGRLVLGKIENLLTARIPREHVAAWIVQIRPELGYIEGKLETIFARPQGLLGLEPLPGLGEEIGYRAKPGDFVVGEALACRRSYRKRTKQ